MQLKFKLTFIDNVHGKNVMNDEWIWVAGKLVCVFRQTQVKEAGLILELQAD